MGDSYLTDTNWHYLQGGAKMNEERGTPQPVNDSVITIQKVTNGFIIVVGCQRFVAMRWEDVGVGLELYFRDPDAAYKKYVTEK